MQCAYRQDSSTFTLIGIFYGGQIDLAAEPHPQECPMLIYEALAIILVKSSRARIAGIDTQRTLSTQLQFEREKHSVRA
jgi:hypothetical protein